MPTQFSYSLPQRKHADNYQACGTRRSMKYFCTIQISTGSLLSSPPFIPMNMDCFLVKFTRQDFVSFVWMEDTSFGVCCGFSYGLLTGLGHGVWSLEDDDSFCTEYRQIFKLEKAKGRKVQI